MINFLLNILELGLIYGVMVLGVHITYKVLDFPDLSVEGTLPLGAAVTASCLASGINPYFACLISMIAGMIAGGITGILNVRLKISGLLAGILLMTGVYSVNLRIMGKANMPLFTYKTIFSNNIHPLIIIIIFALIVKILLDLFLKTKLGFVLTATGDNPQLVTSLGVDTGKLKIFGLMLSNGLVALSGSMLAQYQRFADVGMGLGAIVMGLASIIIGHSIFRKSKFLVPTTMALIGSIIYRLSIAIALRLGFPTTDLKLVTAVIVIIFLAANKGVFKTNLKSISNIKIKIKKIFKKEGDSPVNDKKPIQNI